MNMPFWPLHLPFLGLGTDGSFPDRHHLIRSSAHASENLTAFDVLWVLRNHHFVRSRQSRDEL